MGGTGIPEELAERLARTEPFEGISPREVHAMLRCLHGRVRAYGEGETILRQGETVGALGIVLEGGVRMERVDPWGTRTVLGYVDELGTFAESYACVPGTPLLVDAIAAKPSRIAFLDMGHVVSTCQNACRHHARLATNLLRLSAQRNIELSRRVFHTHARTIRERLLAYLSTEAARAGTRRFAIPYNRQQLADYLGVDRSALSAELSRMQRDGLLRTHRSEFELLG